MSALDAVQITNSLGPAGNAEGEQPILAISATIVIKSDEDLEDQELDFLLESGCLDSIMCDSCTVCASST